VLTSLDVKKTLNIGSGQTQDRQRDKRKKGKEGKRKGKKFGNELGFGNPKNSILEN